MANPSTDSTLRILLVEDTDVDAVLLNHYLKKSGLDFRLNRATSVEAALAALDGIDLVLTDYRLPGENGLSVIRAIKERDPDLPCILVSGQIGEEIAVEALRAGARDFVLKSNLARLVPAILREQAETALRRERRTLELAQIRQAHFLQTLLDTLPSPVFFKDRTGHYQGCNQAFECAFGLSRTQLQGMTVFDLLPLDMAQRSHAKDEALFAEPGIQTYQGTVRFADGTDHEVVFYKGTYADGFSDGLVGTMLDITHLVAVQTALRQSEDRYQRILQVAQEGILTTDKDFRLTFVNHSLEQMFGVPAPALLQCSLESFLRQEDLQDHRRRLMARRGGRSEAYERTLVMPNGEERTVLISATPILNPQGNFDGVFAMLTDITEQKQADLERQHMEIQLRHAQKLEAIGQLAAGIAHEINTPTQYIGDNTIFLRDAFQGVLQFLAELQRETHAEALPHPDTLKARFQTLDLDYLHQEIPRAIQQSLEGVTRVSKIVSAMKDFSHPGGATRMQVDLNRAIESTLTVSRNEWKYLATLETDLDPHLPLVPCFSSEFNQVILNLLVNAAHAINDANDEKQDGRMGLIRVSTRRVDNMAEVRIADSGTGIPKEIQSRIFEPFFTTKTIGKGTGQGLSIARAVIVDKHGGSIDLVSEPGVGTTFILRLPLETLP